MVHPDSFKQIKISDTSDTFCERLMFVLKIKGITKKQLCSSISIPYGTLNRYLRTGTYPSVEVLKDMASFLDVNILWLLGYEMDSNISSSDNANLINYIKDCLENLTSYIDTVS